MASDVLLEAIQPKRLVVLLSRSLRPQNVVALSNSVATGNRLDFVVAVAPGVAISLADYSFRYLCGDVDVEQHQYWHQTLLTCLFVSLHCRRRTSRSLAARAICSSFDQFAIIVLMLAG